MQISRLLPGSSPIDYPFIFPSEVGFYLSLVFLYWREDTCSRLTKHFGRSLYSS